ncbi:carbon-nitrogen hydrolase [Xylariaceae sp. FL1019]|nr:carbon-nitrogen hydrolase [Xylariaceae sp. FL1019]
MPASRKLTVAAAQLGAIQRATPRAEVLDRMIKLLEEAARSHVRLVVFPELALTTFFPRHIIEDPVERAKWFEHESKESSILSGPNAKPLFDAARRLGIDISFGYAERWTEDGTTTDFNTMIYYSVKEDKILAKYRKVHLPGTKQPVRKPNYDEQLEKHFFAPGNLGFQAFRVSGLVDEALKAKDISSKEEAAAAEGKGDPIMGMLLCNDRRWPEGWRCYGLQGIELMLQGYNTTGWAPQRPGDVKFQYDLATFHHKLACQAGSYQNACFSINTAKCGTEDGGLLIAGSVVVAPSGEIIAESKTDQDELVVATIDLADCRFNKEGVFNLGKHREVSHYGRIVEQAGVIEPPFLE